MLRTLLMLMLLVLAAGAYLLLSERAPTTSAQRGIDAPPPALALDTSTPAPSTRELPLLSNLTRTVERPLFSPTRRPGVSQAESPAAEVAPVAQPASSEALPNFTLTAVFRTADAEVVLLRDATSGKIESVRRGEVLGGWRVQSIEAQRVVLVKGEVHHALELRASGFPSVAPAGASSVPAGLLRSPPVRATQQQPPNGSAGATQ